jgi:hypothetical protein
VEGANRNERTPFGPFGAALTRVKIRRRLCARHRRATDELRHTMK